MINEERRKIQEEALEALRKNNFRGGVILPTGTGKSFVLTESLKELYQSGMKVLYVCDSERLRDVDFDKEMDKWGVGEYKEFVEKKCYASAYKLKDEHYDILLADEADYAITPEYSKLFFNNTFKHIIFVSATLEPKKRKIAKEIIPIVYEKKIKEIEDKKVINKCNFVYVPYKLDENENKRYVQFNHKFRELLQSEQTDAVKKQLEFLQIQRKLFLARLQSSVFICKKLLTKLYNEDKTRKFLVFCGVTEQADAIAPSYHTANQQEDNLTKFNNDEIRVLAVCGKVDRGININGVNSVILENIVRSETKMIQRTGRGRRLGVDDVLTVYLPIPYFSPETGSRVFNSQQKPTIVMNWALAAAKDMGIENATTLILTDE